MRVVVTGATGNVGTSLLPALAAHEAVDEIVGVVRRIPEVRHPKTTWVALDVARDPVQPVFDGADAVVHLAWLIQPSRDQDELRRVNVDGSRRVFEAAAAARARTLVYASSVGAYSPGPKREAVDERWPTDGIPTSFYSRHKSEVERILDRVAAEHGDMRTVRLRPGLIFKADAGAEVRRYFAGPFLPSPLVRPELIRVVPAIRRLVFQAVHADDVAAAYRLAVTDERAHGAYNVAADPVMDPDVLARELHALKLPVPATVVRLLADLTWRAHLQPTPPGWLDMALGVPVMDTTRLRALGWQPAKTSLEALRELLEGMSRGAGLETPPMDPAAGGPGRVGELLTGVGHRGV